MKTKVYLAGPSSELPRVLRYAEALEASGVVEITHKWWEAIEEQRKHAITDLTGVFAASIVWTLWPDRHSHGAAFELGFAVAVAQYANITQLVVSGARSSECVFTSLARYRDASDDCALVEVLKLAHHEVRRV